MTAPSPASQPIAAQTVGARILDGRALAAQLRAELATQVAAFRDESGYAPALVVVRVGNDPASVSYAKTIDKSFREAGFGCRLELLPDDATVAQLGAVLERLSADENVHGAIMQRPLPGHMDADAVMSKFPTAKDVEGVTALNMGKLMLNTGNYFPTATPSAAITLLKHAGIPLAGKHAVVAGRSNILGRPMALLLLHENATVTICHSRTRDLGEITRQGDILIAAVGKANLIKREMVKPGATVIDFGVNFPDGGKMRGDVDYEQVKAIAGAITPVPGGTGPVTTVMLMYNTLQAAKNQRSNGQ